MTLEVETVVAVSLLMAVFSAVAAVGTSIVLGVGFERLRSGFEVVRKQTGFFSDIINKLEKKVEKVDEQTDLFSNSINELQAKVVNVGEQANLFAGSMQNLERKVEVVDRQAGFFSDALHKLEQQVEAIGDQPQQPAEEPGELISTGKEEALISRVENLLTSILAGTPQQPSAGTSQPALQEYSFSIPSNLAHRIVEAPLTEKGEIRFH